MLPTLDRNAILRHRGGEMDAFQRFGSIESAEVGKMEGTATHW